MAKVTGSGSAEVFEVVANEGAVFAEGGNDTVNGSAGDDVVHGGGGDDQLVGNDGNDIVFGASTAGGSVDMERFDISEDTTATITFEGESAGFRNTLGVYKINADGSIVDVEIVFANASLKGSGGQLISGQSSVDIPLEAGQQLGFFVVPNAYRKQGNQELLTDPEASWSFVDANGNPGNVNAGAPVNLVHTGADGEQTVVRSQYKDGAVFHSFKGLNPDNYDHVVGEVDVNAGEVRIGFEDLWNGGDKDFDDSVFTVDIGVTNAALLPKEASGADVQSDDDVISGGAGDDRLFGMRGNDVVDGGEGDDRVWGNGGDDTVSGGDGNDVVTGGKGNDVVEGGAGDDLLKGNSGDDVIRGGGGNDVMEGNSGNDTLVGGDDDDQASGGSGDDYFLGSQGDDFYTGGSGFDTIDYSLSRGPIELNLSKHTVSGLGNDEVWGIEKVVGSRFDDTMTGDKRDNVIEGGNGNDVIRGLGGADVLTGGEGSDRFVWASKDIANSDGKSLGVDTITDFQVGDQLDLRRVDGADEADNVKVTDTQAGATVSVRMGDAFVDVVTIEGYSAADLSGSDFLV